ncbi:MAG: hypothetical protein LBG72_09685 [Spirochaetaceae bacterium]|nr:hypothetical protein [Spirochaetaceae bacterium]
MKRTTLQIGWLAMVAVILSGLVAVFASCEQGTNFNGTEIAANASRQASEVKVFPDDIIDYVYGGNPGGIAGSWTDFDFRADGTVVIQTVTATTNSSVDPTYTYDDVDYTVTITGYGVYQLTNDGSTLIAPDGSRYPILRTNDTDTPPPDYTSDPAYLVGTVFTASGPRTPDWVTFTFRDFDTGTNSGTVIGSFTIDNTTNVWTYTYNSTTGIGTITANPGQTSPGEFTHTVGSKLVFTSFFGHAPGWTAYRWQ